MFITWLPGVLRFGLQLRHVRGIGFGMLKDCFQMKRKKIDHEKGHKQVFIVTYAGGIVGAVASGMLVIEIALTILPA